MTKLYDLAVVTRKYTDKNGNEKNAWENVGTVIQSDKGPYVMLKAHFMPAGIQRKDGTESIFVSLFAAKNANDPEAYEAFNYIPEAGHKLYDLAVATRHYQTANGEDKTVWQNVGVVMQGENGPYMMLKAHFNPAAIQRKEGSESIAISMFKAKAKDESSHATSRYTADDEDSYQLMNFDTDSFSPESLSDTKIPF